MTDTPRPWDRLTAVAVVSAADAGHVEGHRVPSDTA